MTRFGEIEPLQVKLKNFEKFEMDGANNNLDIKLKRADAGGGDPETTGSIDSSGNPDNFYSIDLGDGEGTLRHAPYATKVTIWRLQS